MVISNLITSMEMDPVISVGPSVSNWRSAVNGVWLSPGLRLRARDWLLMSLR